MPEHFFIGSPELALEAASRRRVVAVVVCCGLPRPYMLAAADWAATPPKFRVAMVEAAAGKSKSRNMRKIFTNSAQYPIVRTKNGDGRAGVAGEFAEDLVARW